MLLFPDCLRICRLCGAVYDRDLIIQRPEVIDIADPQYPQRQQVNDAADPFPHIHPVDSKKAQEGQQDPGDRIIDPSQTESNVRLTMQGRDQEKVDQPTDAQKAESAKVDGSGNRFAEIETVRPGETEDPEHITDKNTMACTMIVHIAPSKSMSPIHDSPW